MTQSVVKILVTVACAVTVAACGGGGTDNPAAAPPRLPVEPGKDATPIEVPRITRDMRQWKQPRLIDTRDWQLAIADLGEQRVVRYRVPLQWTVDQRGRAKSGDELVQSYVELASVDKDEISLPAYAAQLSEGSKLQYKRMANGEVAFLTVREISIAPSDPNAPRFMYHTAVVDLGDSLAKLEVRYSAKHRWRFANQASAIIGTIQAESAVRAEG